MRPLFYPTLILAMILTTWSADAKVFRNAYVSFELPDSWKCALQHTEWVCRSEQTKESKEAIIILTAKEVGPTDSFDSYTQHLSQSQTIKTRAGGQVSSRVVYAPKQVKINDQVWIDGLQQSSEVVNYFTRYLATIKDRIAVLVTLSAHKDFYTKYSQDFYKAVMSLRVIATSNLLAKPELGPLRPGGEMIGGSIGAAMPSELDESGLNEAVGEGGSAGGTQNLMIGLALVLAAVGGYILMKSKRS
ncbi:MAG: hypothetical protein ACK5UJ_02685 [Pseudobdellovibrionaceae bacterium]